MVVVETANGLFHPGGMLKVYVTLSPTDAHAQRKTSAASPFVIGHLAWVWGFVFYKTVVHQFYSGNT